MISNYTHFTPLSGSGILFRCVTGLGPSGDSNDELGGLYFGGSMLQIGNCNGPPVIQPRDEPISRSVGVINAFICQGLTAAAEGVYTCAMRNSDMVNESMSVGVYFSDRSKSLPF